MLLWVEAEASCPSSDRHRVRRGILHGLTRVVDLDLSGCFDNIRHHLLLGQVGCRVRDAEVMDLVRLIHKANGTKGVPQGGVISPLLSNLYLNGVDEMMEKAREDTRRKGYDSLDFVRRADDMVTWYTDTRKRTG